MAAAPPDSWRRRLGLEQATDALGIVGSFAGGLFEYLSDGSATKPLHAGRAAENGVTAAELASRGFTAGDEPLDGEWGFFQVLGGGADLPRIVPTLGRPFSIVDVVMSLQKNNVLELLFTPLKRTCQ